MSSTQELLQAITGLQERAQDALPVLPNNGNPRGANNMPKVVQQPQQAAPAPVQPPDRFPWLKASPAMDGIRNMLESRRGAFSNRSV
jgi:hypothetical protein